MRLFFLWELVALDSSSPPSTCPRLTLTPLPPRHRPREPEDGLGRGERPGLGDVVRRGAVAHRRLPEEPREPTHLRRGRPAAASARPPAHVQVTWPHYGRDEAAVSVCFSCLLSVPESFLAAPLPVESDAKHLHVPSGRKEDFMSSCCVCDAGESTSLLRSPLWVCPLTGDGPPLLVDRLVVLPAASRRGCSYMLFVLASVDLRRLIKLDMLQW